MPESCLDCRFHKSIHCILTDICTNTMQKCPLIPVPDHGRLIDAGALMESDLGGEPYKSVIRRVLMQAPTVIEADKEGA